MVSSIDLVYIYFSEILDITYIIVYFMVILDIKVVNNLIVFFNILVFVICDNSEKN